VGHMRFLAQGEERVAALELSSILMGLTRQTAEDPVSRRLVLAHLMRRATSYPQINHPSGPCGPNHFGPCRSQSVRCHNEWGL
jgi:hypothetical protein